MPLYTVDEIMTRCETKTGKVFSPIGIGTFTGKFAFQTIKDGYDQVTAALRFPRKSVTIKPQPGIRQYPLPDDCWDGVKGVDRITFAGQPINAIRFQEAVDRFGYEINNIPDLACGFGDSVSPTDLLAQSNPQSWYNPPSVNGITYWIDDDGSRMFSVIRTPGINDCVGNNVFTVYYIQSFPRPTARTDYVPDAFEPMIGPLSIFLMGTCMDADKSGRGSALISEFNAYLLKQQSRQKRGRRQTTPEAYTLGMNAYIYDYKGSTPNPYR